MTPKLKLTLTFGVLAIAIGAVLIFGRGYPLLGGHGRVVDDLIARNIATRGGADAWRAVSSLRYTGLMDLGQGMHVPYTVEQKRPGRMCLEFEFEEQTAVQCVSGDRGWKLLPFRGRYAPEPMSAAELREMAGGAEIDGLLFESARRGDHVELVGHETVDGRDTVKLELTLHSGAKRWVYLDVETALEVKVDTLRTVRGEERLVETYYYVWQDTGGLLIPRYHEMRIGGEDDTRFLSIDEVIVNPLLKDTRFEIPTSADARSVGAGGRTG